MPWFIATLNNYTCSLSPLANVNWSAFPECLLLTMWIHNWWNGANKELQISSRDLTLLALSWTTAYIGLVMGHWPIVSTCGCHRDSKPAICVMPCFFILAFVTTHPTPATFLLTPYLCWPKINQFLEKMSESYQN